MEVWRADPTFTNWIPKTAVEAVDRFTRCQRNGLRPMLVPECLIACAHGLCGEQLDLFEAWIINPGGSLENLDLIEQSAIRAANDKIFEENAARIEAHWTNDLPPVPDADDEKIPMPRMRRQVSSDYANPCEVQEDLAPPPQPADQLPEAPQTPPETSTASPNPPS